MCMWCGVVGYCVSDGGRVGYHVYVVMWSGRVSCLCCAVVG